MWGGVLGINWERCLIGGEGDDKRERKEDGGEGKKGVGERLGEGEEGRKRGGRDGEVGVSVKGMVRIKEIGKRDESESEGRRDGS